MKYQTWHTGLVQFGSIPVFILALIYAPNQWFWVLAVMHFLFMGIGIRAGGHALFTHNSYDAPDWWKAICLYFYTASNDGPLPNIAAFHRVHHQFSGSDDDPDRHHFFYRFNNIMPSKERIKREWVRLMRDDKWMKLSWNYHQHILLLHIALCTIVAFVLDDSWAIAFLWLLPAGTTIWAYEASQILSHNTAFPFTYRRYNLGEKDTSSNNLILSILFCGEGIHNNHHAKPRDWKFAHTWWEWLVDWPAAFIWLVKKR